MTTQGQFHPAAELFPMMSVAELEALAADILENGQRQPIVLLDGQVLDGRNRLRACEMAKVQPEFVDANGADPLALVVSLNVKRRNLSKGQTAIAAAEAWDSPSLKVGSGKRAAHLAKVFGVSRAYVEQARALVERDPVAAEAVKGGASLNEALDALMEREREAARQQRERERIQDAHADLLDAVERGDMTLIEAMTEARSRDDQAAATEREAAEARHRLYGYLAPALEHLCWPGSDDDITRRAEHTASELIQFNDMTAERFRLAAKTAMAIASAMEEAA